MNRKRTRKKLVMVLVMAISSFTQAGCSPAEVLRAIAQGLNAVAGAASQGQQIGSTGNGDAMPLAPVASNALPATDALSPAAGLSANAGGLLPTTDTSTVAPAP